MARVAISTGQVTAKQPIDDLLEGSFQGNDLDHEGRILNLEGANNATIVDGLISIPNGSFEIDGTNTLGGTTGNPFGWTAAMNANGSTAIDNTTNNQVHGANSIKIIGSAASNNGGTQTSNNFFPVNALNPMWLSFWTQSSVAGVLNTITIYWYNPNFTANATPSTIVFTSVNNPLSWAKFIAKCTPPTGAAWCKVQISGVIGTTSGTAWFDEVEFVKHTYDNGRMWRGVPAYISPNYQVVCDASPALSYPSLPWTGANILADSGGSYLTFGSSASSGTLVGIQLNSACGALMPGDEYFFKFQAQTGTSNGIGFFFSGLVNPDPTVADPLANQTGFAFYGVAGSVFKASSNNASASSNIITTTANFDTNIHELRVLVGSGVITVMLDNIGYALTTKVPAAGAQGTASVYMKNTAAANSILKFYHAYGFSRY